MQNIDIVSVCPKCTQPLSSPQQVLYVKKRRVYCRVCGYEIIPINQNESELDPNKKACLLCTSFQFGICTNGEAHEIKEIKNKNGKVIREVRTNFVGKSIHTLPKNGCDLLDVRS